MALFSAKKETTKKPATKKVEETSTAEVVTSSVAAKVGGLDLSKVLVRPHVTEKATDLAESGNVYAFEIHQSANKAQVKLAVEKLFKVTPEKVAIINIKSKYMKSRQSNRVVLKKPGLKKALIHLKKGDKIEFV